MRGTNWRTKVLLVQMLIGSCGGAVAAPLSGAARDRLPHAAFASVYLEDCRAFAPQESCELTGDLDGDGKPERVFKIRARKGGKVGIAVAWADGRYSALGAGARTLRVRTEVYQDGTKEPEVALNEPLDLAGITTWKILPPAREGFASHSNNPKSVYRAPSVVGHGIFISGGDAAEMLYWDGGRWRWLILGF